MGTVAHIEGDLDFIFGPEPAPVVTDCRACGGHGDIALGGDPEDPDLEECGTCRGSGEVTVEPDSIEAECADLSDRNSALTDIIARVRAIAAAAHDMSGTPADDLAADILLALNRKGA